MTYLSKKIYICLKKYFMDTGYKIRKLRGEKGFSQEYMATQVGVSQRTYGRFETSQSKIDIEMIAKIAKVLDIDPYELIDFKDQNTFNNNDQQGGNATNICHAININFNVFSEEIKNLYEKIIDEKNEQIKLLENRLKKN